MLVCVLSNEIHSSRDTTNFRIFLPIVHLSISNFMLNLIIIWKVAANISPYIRLKFCWFLYDLKHSYSREFYCSNHFVNETGDTRYDHSSMTCSADQCKQIKCDITMGNSMVTLKSLFWFVWAISRGLFC